MMVRIARATCPVPAAALTTLFLLLHSGAPWLVDALAPALSSSKVDSTLRRREVLWKTPAAAAFAAVMALATPKTADADESNDSPMATINELLSRLQGIPTFSIVSQETGAAYMLFKKDQSVAIGYAFTTFPGALAVLGDAQRVSKEKGYFDTWKDATITVVPLDIAVRLALKKKARVSPNMEQQLDTLLMVIPGVVRTYCTLIARIMSADCIA